MKCELSIPGDDITRWVSNNWDGDVTELVYTNTNDEPLRVPKLPPSVRTLRVTTKGSLTLDASPDLEQLFLIDIGEWSVDAAYFNASTSLRVLSVTGLDGAINCIPEGVVDMRGAPLRIIKIDNLDDAMPLLPWTARHVDIDFATLGPETFATRPALKNILISTAKCHEVSYDTLHDDISYETLQHLVVDIKSLPLVIPPYHVEVLPNHRPGMTVFMGLDVIASLLVGVETREKFLIRDVLENIGDLVSRVVVCIGDATPGRFTEDCIEHIEDVKKYGYTTKKKMRRAIKRSCPYATVEFVKIDTYARQEYGDALMADV